MEDGPFGTLVDPMRDVKIQPGRDVSGQGDFARYPKTRDDPGEHHSPARRNLPSLRSNGNSHCDSGLAGQREVFARDDGEHR